MRRHCSWTIEVDLEPNGRTSVKVPDLHSVSNAVPSRTLARLKKEVDRAGGFVGPSFPVVATLRMRLECQLFNDRFGVHAISMVLAA